MHSISLQPPTPSYGDKREPTPLTHSAIAQACDRSPDNGYTLVLSKLNLSDVSPDAAEELATIGRKGPDDECIVERVTLGSNRLTTLPTEFALLSRLRYLNLKHNNFSSFPDVLTVLPSLDTLDISHNKIKRFPAHAGRLVDLRVFSFSRNKITRLPQYFGQFKNLEILKLDRNPLEWPPRNILQSDVPHEDEEAMKEWIVGILEWIDYNTSPMKANDDSGYAETPDWDPNLKHDKQKAWRFPLQDLDSESAASSHNRTFSVESQASSYQDDSVLEAGPAQNRGAAHFKRALYNPIVTAPDHPSETYLSSPADSEKFDLQSSSSQNGLSDINHPPSVHLRAASVAAEQRKPPSSHVFAKQSLPDLRSPQWSKLTESPEQNFTDFIASRPEPLQRMAAIRQQSLPSVDTKAEISAPTAADHPAPSMAFERNSYFQRLSTMPTSVKLPTPLLSLVETARSILFVTSQIYQTIEHYANHAIDEKYSAGFKRVLEPANSDMLQLIRALDRFDTTSQKSLPHPHLCRAIAETCRNTVLVTNRAIGIFAIQLRMAPCEDHRYSRWILLELYASTAEVSVAWQNLLPHMDALKAFFQAKPSHYSRPSLTKLDYLQGDSHHTSLRLRNADFAATRTHSARLRRQAGSFSFRDVELGKVLPSIDEPLGSSGGLAGQTPTLRIPKRQATAPPAAPSLGSSLSLPGPYPPAFSFGRSEPSLLRHSRESSFEQPLRSAPTGSKLKSLDLPMAVRQKPDREALLSIRQAVDSSSKVWDMIEDAITPSDATSKEAVKKTREITRKLSIGLRNAIDSDKLTDSQLNENAQSFLKFVNQLSTLVKNGTLSRSAVPALQSHLVRLAEAAEDLVKMLSASSSVPSSSRPYSPQFSNPFSTPQPDDNRLGTSLSRARSAQPTPTSKSPPTSLYDSPKSAQPTSSGFRIPTMTLSRGASSRDVQKPGDVGDPG